MFTVKCKCGWQSEIPRERPMAEVLANYHEALNQRRAYAHDAEPIPIQK